jgi:phosphomannomutase
VVPISCNDAIDRGRLKEIVEPKTKIGSPYVIAGMEKAQARGRRRVCGWEANGGFLTGSDIERNGRILKALPTRDAVLPILCTLFAAHDEGLPLAGLFSRLPKRFSRAALLKGIPRQVGLKIVRELSPAAGAVREIVFGAGQVLMLDEQGGVLPSSAAGIEETEFLRKRLERFFGPDRGFGSIARANYVDGVRAIFCNGDVAHVRPSGNADELRIYAVADTQSRADEIADLGIAEPDGILRSLERALPEF